MSSPPIEKHRSSASKGLLPDLFFLDPPRRTNRFTPQPIPSLPCLSQMPWKIRGTHDSAAPPLGPAASGIRLDASAACPKRHAMTTSTLATLQAMRPWTRDADLLDAGRISSRFRPDPIQQLLPLAKSTFPTPDESMGHPCSQLWRLCADGTCHLTSFLCILLSPSPLFRSPPLSGLRK